MKLHQKLLRVTAAALTAAWGLLTPCQVFAAPAPPDAIASVTVNKMATYYYDTPASGGMDAMWEYAFRSSEATVKLYADWKPANGTCFTKTGTGTVYDGALCIPAGSQITVDLNGFSIDRGLEASIMDGEVFYVSGGGVLNVTDTSTGQTGRITGGNSINSAGGIHVDTGGTLNIWGGSISGNRTEESGGGVFLAGPDSSLYMTGGRITENHAEASAGGLCAVDSSIRVISGEISDNTTAGNGGGMLLTGGTTDLAGCKVTGNTALYNGGGLYVDGNATLLLKEGTIIQKNKLSGDENSENDGIGGGILMLSPNPIRVSGASSVSMNTNRVGTQSNLSFAVEEGRIYPGGRMENDGLSDAARFGVSFYGGKEREHCIAAGWTGERIFSPDSADFTLLSQDGSLYLQRPKDPPGVWIYVVIGVGVAAILSVIAFFVLRSMNRKHKQRRRKKKKAAAKS